MTKTLFKQFTIKQLAEMTGCEFIGDGSLLISGVAPLESARDYEASFFGNARYVDALKSSKAGLICIDPDSLAREKVPGRNYLITDNPSLTFQQLVVAILQPSNFQSGFTGIDATARIHPSVTLGKGVTVGPYAVIDQNCEIGDNTRIDALASIGPGVTIGQKCHFHPHVVVREACRIGDRVILQPGAVIGSCGFGYSTSAIGVHTKIEHFGIVVLEDDVEIGANTTIDKARFQETLIGVGSKIDNQVQIGHNVIIGKHNMIVSQVGIAGSSKTGNNVTLGGQTGVAGHIEIGDRTTVAAVSGVTKSLPADGLFQGTPAIPLLQYKRQSVHVKTLPGYVKELRELTEKVRKLEEKLLSK